MTVCLACQERELEDPLYLMQRHAAFNYHSSALAEYTRSPHMHVSVSCYVRPCQA
jgi:hypothetical protein